MLKIIIRSITLLLPTFVHADPIETLLSAVHARNFAAVAEQIATAPDRTSQRDLVWALAATDPETVDFTKAWVAAEEDSPAALSARAWSLYWTGAQIRGERLPSQTARERLAETKKMYREALALAQRASQIDPKFLPASDAVILIGLRVGIGEDALIEFDRIMKVDPNRHSLVLTVSALTPNWGGSLELMKSLCDYYAPLVADVEDYDSDTCLAQAILRGELRGEPKEWAIQVVELQADKPFLEREVVALARENRLPPPSADLLAARLKAEGRMSAYLILSMRQDLIESPQLPTDFADALNNDLSAARLAATRDPGDVDALIALEEVFQIETRYWAQRGWREPNLTDAERQAIPSKATDVEALHTKELDSLSRKLIRLVPQSSEALTFVAQHVVAPDPDPLKSDSWAFSLLINAAIYANRQDKQLGLVAMEMEKRYDLMQERMRSGDAPNYSQAQLDDAYLCPYARAVRVIDEVCAHSQYSEQNCILEALMGYPSPSTLKDSLYGKITERGACKVERDAPIETLGYQLVDLTPLP